MQNQVKLGWSFKTANELMMSFNVLYDGKSLINTHPTKHLV